jgi:malate synthase
VEVATECFDKVLGDRPNQLDRQRPEVNVEARELVDVRISGGKVTEAGLRLNVSVGIQYLESWLRGNGAAAINNLMEDAATAEISRSQVWQWVHHHAKLDDGRAVDHAMVSGLEDDEMEQLQKAYGPELWAKGHFDDARAIFEEVALADAFIDFLTVPAYERLG